jgi:uncharacterized membrane protein YcjF (UPF0283 family)
MDVLAIIFLAVTAVAVIFIGVLLQVVLRELRRLHSLMEKVAEKVRPQEVRPRIEAA